MTAAVGGFFLSFFINGSIALLYTSLFLRPGVLKSSDFKSCGVYSRLAFQTLNNVTEQWFSK